MANGRDPNLEALAQQASYAAGAARAAAQQAQQNSNEVANVRGQMEGMAKSFSAMSAAIQALSTSRAGMNPSLQYVENIPGRRIPMDMLVDIPFGANVNSVQQGSITIPQHGPFVAVARYATFQSQYAFQFTDPETSAQTTFQGRSFGRFRPIHSAGDLNDGLPRSEVYQTLAFPGTAQSHTLSPSNGSPFRTMEADYRITLKDAGLGFPRSNIEVPSTWWCKEIADPFELGALDVFERGSVITFDVLPTHVNNPAFGSISGFGAVNSVFPFAGSGWDYIEGVSDPETATITADPVVRVPNGILTIGLHGYMIVQPPGVSGGY